MRGNWTKKMTQPDQDSEIQIRIEAKIVYLCPPKSVAEEALRAQANAKIQAMASKMDKDIYKLLKALW